MLSPGVPLAFLGVAGACQLTGAATRIALIAGTAGAAAAAGLQPGWLMACLEAGALAGLVLPLAGQPWRPWLRRGLACLLGLAALNAGWPGRPAVLLLLTALAVPLVLSALQPLLARGAYDFVQRERAEQAVRWFGGLDALLQLLCPVAVGAAVQHLGGHAVYAVLAALLTLACLLAWRLPPARHHVGEAERGPIHLQLAGLSRPLRLLLGVAMLEHLLVSGFFVAYSNAAVQAGWNASELGLGLSLVYGGALLAMAAPLPRQAAGRWALFLLAATGLPAALRVAFALLDPGAAADKPWLLLLLTVVGLGIGVEQLVVGVLKFQWLRAEQAAGIHRLLLLATGLAGLLGTGLASLGGSLHPMWPVWTTAAMAGSSGLAAVWLLRRGWGRA